MLPVVRRVLLDPGNESSIGARRHVNEKLTNWAFHVTDENAFVTALLFGHREADVLGRNVNMLMPSPYREEHHTYLSRYLATGRPRSSASAARSRGCARTAPRFPSISRWAS
jgi:PAS domain S-box-containing protein